MNPYALIILNEKGNVPFMSFSKGIDGVMRLHIYDENHDRVESRRVNIGKTKRCSLVKEILSIIEEKGDMHIFPNQRFYMKASDFVSRNFD